MQHKETKEENTEEITAGGMLTHLNVRNWTERSLEFKSKGSKIWNIKI